MLADFFIVEGHLGWFSLAKNRGSCDLAMKKISNIYERDELQNTKKVIRSLVFLYPGRDSVPIVFSGAIQKKSTDYLNPRHFRACNLNLAVLDLLYKYILSQVTNFPLRSTT